MSNLTKARQFNPERYLYLKNKRSSLRKQNKYLTKSERLELSTYSSQYFSYLCWQQRLIFLSLIQKCARGEIQPEDFYIEFHFLWRNNQKLLSSPSLETLQKVKIVPEAPYFSLLIENIAVSIDLYEFSTDDDDSAEIRLKNAVSKEYAIFLKSDPAIDVEIELDPLLLESSSEVEYRDGIALQETMIFFTVVISVVYRFLNPTIFNLIWKE